MRKIPIFVSISLFFVFSMFVFAQESPSPTLSPSRTSIKREVKETIKNTRVEIKDMRKDTKTDIKDERKDIKTNLTGKTPEERKQVREDFNEKVKQEQEALKTKIETKREDLKQQLQKVKDEKKKQTVERIDQSIDKLNDKMVKHFGEVLDKIDKTLDNISSRADKAAQERGADVALVRKAIDDAHNAVDVARLAVESQAGKTYIITVSSEGKLKIDVQKARQALHTDLKKVEGAVKAAHEATRKAAVALAQLKKIASPSPSLSPSPSVTTNP